MIDIKFHKSINQLKDKWKKLEVGVSPFQTFEMNQMVWRNRLFYYLREKKTFIYAEVIEDGNTRLIAPLCRNIIGGGTVLFQVLTVCEIMILCMLMKVI